MSDILKKRGYVCKEIVDTEERYVRDLEVIINVFMDPMKRKRIVSEELIMGIFGNIPILLNINKKLLESLNAAVKRDSDSPDYANANLGAVLLKFCPFFKMYSNYCKLQTKATVAIRELKKTSKFANFYNSCKKNPACRGMEMTSFLIMPVQRIPRYQLLLKELQKRTPADHPDMPFIQKALTLVANVAQECDSAMKGDKETSLKLSIQNSLGSKFTLMKASRKLLRYARCTWVYHRERIPVTVFLFSDLLIFANQFANDVDLKVVAKYELYMFEYAYDAVTPTSVRASNVFERFFLDFETAELARDWHAALSQALQGVLQRTIGTTCEVCFGPLKPAFCCHCVKCDRICCEHCCGYINTQDRMTASKNMACLSCVDYNNKILSQNTIIKELVQSTNASNRRDFIQPRFVCDLNRKTQVSLPEGWEACILGDSRVYYFNRQKWLSSWSLPKEEFVNDAPYGWQKYYDEKDHGYYYNARTSETSFSRPEKQVLVCMDCPGCDYVISKSDVRKGYCPCCNTSLKGAF